MTLTTMLKTAATNHKPTGPLWKGPEVDGVTQSMLAGWLVCKERFRIKYVLGWVPVDKFNHRTGYGDMWHLCEEEHAKGGPDSRRRSDGYSWEGALRKHCQDLRQRYQAQQDEVNKWYQVCKVQFPLYVAHWSKHQDVKDRTPLLQEQVFDVPYTLPSGRTVRLRGKWDSVDLIGKGKGAGVYLFETKTKGDIDEQQIKRQLTFDLQTMLYLVALDEGGDQPTNLPGGYSLNEMAKNAPILGIRYNVIRRPLSGGKGTIKQHEATNGAKCTKCKGVGKLQDSYMIYQTCPKCRGQGRIGGKPAETNAEFFQRLEEVISTNTSDFFMRWRVEISGGDISNFRKQCLDPILEQISCWYNSQVGKAELAPSWSQNYRMPFGIYSPLLDGGGTEYDEFLASGSTVGLTKADKLFKELV